MMPKIYFRRNFTSHLRDTFYKQTYNTKCTDTTRLEFLIRDSVNNQSTSVTLMLLLLSICAETKFCFFIIMLIFKTGTRETLQEPLECGRGEYDDGHLKTQR